MQTSYNLFLSPSQRREAPLGEGYYFRSAIYTRVNANIAKCKVILHVMDERRTTVFVVMRMRESSQISKIWRTTWRVNAGWRLPKRRKRRPERLPQDYKRHLRRDKCWKKAEKRGETILDWHKTSLLIYCLHYATIKLLRICVKGRRSASRIHSVHC